MILTRFVRIQLVIFAIVGTIALVVVAVSYLNLPALMGVTQYQISARFENAAGLYPAANVTVRGKDIGEVERIRLHEGTIEVVMSINDGVRIPADVDAEAHSRSAVGEQYIRLVPHSSGEPYLQPGDVIPRERTSVPVDIGPLLERVNSLVASLPRDDLQTVVDEAYQAFRGTGPDLQRLLDHAQRLLTAADRNYQPTEQLIDDLGPLLTTQQASSSEIRSLTEDLARFTETLRHSDPELREVLNQGQPFAEQITGLFQDLQPTLPILLANLTTVGEVLVTYNAALEQVLVLYPAVVAALQTATVPYADIAAGALDFKATVNVPPPCTTGFIPLEQRRLPSQTEVIPTPEGIYCKLPQDSPTAVRGARNLPCQAVPGKRAATPAQCRGDGFEPQGENRWYPVITNSGTSGKGPDSAAASSTTTLPYDPETGVATTPDGHFLLLGGVGTQTPPRADRTWRSLLLEPIEN